MTHKSRRVLVVIAGCLAVLLVSACGEKEPVVVYKQGKYQGKADTRPWDNPTFAGDKAKWEGSIRSRNQNQNEYKRI